MRKATLTQNTLLKHKFRFLVTGLGGDSNRVISVGGTENEVGVIERPDKTKISAGRTGGGSFDIAIEFADDLAFRAYQGWYLQSVDGGLNNEPGISANSLNGPIQGIDPGYKRTATLVHYRLYKSQAANEQPRTVTYDGCFISKFAIDESNIDSEEHQTATFTCNYDDMRIAI